ncbi:TetR family transcriptional regulator [Paraburkholderia sp. BL23I1N1]|uniref:TetR/AcrR family transcriptional regulator n=1 Tax=Paraburkholderia sp. BL23I1N1 TaxID=1938802 RepID=UPI000FEF0C5C|nr:TetR/AcrR family transcriptional regulator [Paraburkholderia sp. BL23I1N1]RKE39942.1 TetR family transcriptional regulator [Paraburkholderia sp. BL23I1N1]
MQPDATLPGGDKRDRILDSALMLFLRYGVKRTSIDDIAREVGIAKGTIYLSFDSKAALFAAIADRLCATTLSNAEQIASGVTPPTERIVDVLDCYIGETHRLVSQSPHIAELTASREALATQAFQTLDRQIRALLNTLLSEAGIDRDGADAMFIAAGLGTLQTGDNAAQPYRARLRAMVDTLMAGLACLAKV